MQTQPFRRRVQVVSTLAERKRVIQWMVNRVEETGTAHRIAAEAVDAFSDVFSQRDRAANRAKAARWWKERELYLSSFESTNRRSLSTTSRGARGNGVRRARFKTVGGRGRKCPEWKLTFSFALCDEFRRLRALGVQVSRELLREAALHLVQQTHSPVTVAQIENATGKPYTDVLSRFFVQDFCKRYNIKYRARSSSKSLSPEAMQQIHRHVAHQLGELKREYENGLDQSTVENYDETHLVIDMETGRVLDFEGARRPTYLEVSSGGQGFTVAFRLSGGLNAKIEPAFVVFKNGRRNYPIGGVPDDVQGVAYRSNPTGWVDGSMFIRYFTIERIICSLSGGRTRRLYVDSCRSHNETAALNTALEGVDTELRRFHPNCTHLIQPLDQLILRAFKEEWRKLWDKEKAERARNGEFTDTGRIVNPGKHFMLELVKQVIDRLNDRVIDGISLARRSMIMCGLLPDVTGTWTVTQLTSELQKIVNENLPYFDGQDPNE